MKTSATRKFTEMVNKGEHNNYELEYPNSFTEEQVKFLDNKCNRYVKYGEMLRNEFGEEYEGYQAFLGELPYYMNKEMEKFL